MYGGRTFHTCFLTSYLLITFKAIAPTLYRVLWTSRFHSCVRQVVNEWLVYWKQFVWCHSVVPLQPAIQLTLHIFSWLKEVFFRGTDFCVRQPQAVGWMWKMFVLVGCWPYELCCLKCYWQITIILSAKFIYLFIFVVVVVGLLLSTHLVDLNESREMLFRMARIFLFFYYFLTIKSWAKLLTVEEWSFPAMWSIFPH